MANFSRSPTLFVQAIVFHQGKVALTHIFTARVNYMNAKEMGHAPFGAIVASTIFDLT
jgi:hypothetical protein